MRKKHTLHTTAKHTNNASDWQKFKTQRNNLSNILREAENDYIMNRSSELYKPKGIKHFWSYLKVILWNPTLLTHNSKVYSDDAEKKPLLNNFFVDNTIINSANKTGASPSWDGKPVLAHLQGYKQHLMK